MSSLEPYSLRSPRLLWTLIPVICGLSVATLFFAMALDRDIWTAATRVLRFAVWPAFNDLAITLDHLREASAGNDVLTDPSSQFAYPRAVLLFRHLGLQYIPAPWIGLAQGIALTLTVVLVLRPSTPRRAIGTAALFFTPAFLLGFERGNLDLPLFSLCAFAAWLWSRCTPGKTAVLAVSALLGATLLKLYPVFGLAAGAVADRSRRRLTWIAGALLAGIYFYSIRFDLEFIQAKVPVMTHSSWGSLVSFAGLEEFLRTHHLMAVTAGDLSFIGTLSYAAVFIVAAALGKYLAPHFEDLGWRRDEWAYYWVGAGICSGCFAAANFAYRWIFAILTLPLVLRAATSDDPLLKTWARITIVALFAGLAAKFTLPSLLFVTIQLANWLFIFALIVGASALYFSSIRRQETPLHQMGDSTGDATTAIYGPAHATARLACDTDRNN